MLNIPYITSYIYCLLRSCCLVQSDEVGAFCYIAQERNGVKAARPAGAAKPVIVDADMEKEKQLAAMVCSLENKDECLMCGS